ncbi:MAG: hypothetical protein EAX81_03520 [Candidatus Thorarchaeota archaeon]|nr:hypothetical protein [Candidatus Thorarchaeota archaeon]
MRSTAVNENTAGNLRAKMKRVKNMELSTTHILRRRICNSTSILILACLLSQALFVPATVAALQPAQQNTNVWVRVDGQAYPDAVFSDVKFINATHGWVVGESNYQGLGDGIVLNTNDGGITWKERLNDSDRLFSRIDIVENHTAWVSSLGSLFYSSDFGITWNESKVVVGNTLLPMVEFTNSSHGWTSTADTLFKTTNGGSSWNPVPSWTFNDTLRHMVFVTQSEVHAIGFFGIYHSSDGAETWEQVSFRGGWSLSFVSESEGWAIGDNRLAHTADGSTWTELTIPGSFLLAPYFRMRLPYCSDILFLDADHGWIVGDETAVMYTPNGGTDWYKQSVGSIISRMSAVDFINQTHGWITGWDGIILRTTAGNTIGTRLWAGFADPLFLSIAGVVTIVIVTGITSLVWFRRRRSGKATTTLEEDSGLALH